MELKFKKGDLKIKTELLKLYKRIAVISGGIIRIPNEINEEYISSFLTNAIDKGLMLTASLDEKIVGEIHAYTPDIYAFQHILTDLTIVVDSNYQGKGIGRELFEKFLTIVMDEFTHIKRIELYTREQSKKNIKFYKSLGFLNEGCQKDKIYISNSKFETPVHMAWFNPNYGIKIN